MPRERPFWEIPWRFAVHAVVGSLIFGIIAGFAIGLGLLVRWLRHEISDDFIIYGLIGAEYLLFATDLAMFAVFLVRTAEKMIREFREL
jgi:hypothetical protein